MLCCDRTEERRDQQATDVYNRDAWRWTGRCRVVCCAVIGLKSGEINKPQTFTIETRGAGQGGVGLSVVGPTEPKIGCVDNHDGTLTVEYLPNSVGSYEIAVSFADQPVPGLLLTRTTTSQ